MYLHEEEKEKLRKPKETELMGEEGVSKAEGRGLDVGVAEHRGRVRLRPSVGSGCCTCWVWEEKTDVREQEGKRRIVAFLMCCWLFCLNPHCIFVSNVKH